MNANLKLAVAALFGVVAGVAGDTPLKLLAVHIVDKGKPLAEPVAK
jgi:hypothetical protein